MGRISHTNKASKQTCPHIIRAGKSLVIDSTLHGLHLVLLRPAEKRPDIYLSEEYIQ